MSRTSSALREYIDATFAPEDALLQSIRAQGEALRPGMQISAGEGKLLYMLAKMVSAKRVLEIGCFMGYSAVWLARALGECGELITLEANEEYADLAQSHFDDSALPITLMRGKALETISSVQGPFDVIFIDADKANYANYLEASLPLLREGGLMIGDNTLLFGHMHAEPKQKSSPAAIAAMQAFNKAIASSEQLEGVLIPTDEGLSVAIKRALPTK